MADRTDGARPRRPRPAQAARGRGPLGRNAHAAARGGTAVHLLNVGLRCVNCQVSGHLLLLASLDLAKSTVGLRRPPHIGHAPYLQPRHPLLPGGVLLTAQTAKRSSAGQGTIGGPITSESPAIPGNRIQSKTAELSVYADYPDDCHAEGRGFESHQPLSRSPANRRVSLLIERQ